MDIVTQEKSSPLEHKLKYLNEWSKDPRDRVFGVIPCWVEDLFPLNAKPRRDCDRSVPSLQIITETDLVPTFPMLLHPSFLPSLCAILSMTISSCIMP